MKHYLFKRYLILPLAEWKISILAISMYQCDYVLIQESDYERVIRCLSNHIPKIYDESLPQENEIVFMRSKGKSIFNLKSITSNNLAPGATQQKLANDLIQQKNQMQIMLPLLIPDDIEYCITGLYDLEKFIQIMPILIEIMFYETE